MQMWPFLMFCVAKDPAGRLPSHIRLLLADLGSEQASPSPGHQGSYSVCRDCAWLGLCPGPVWSTRTFLRLVIALAHPVSEVPAES